MEWIKLLVDAGGLGLMVIVVVCFLRHQKDVSDSFIETIDATREACIECRREHMQFIGNHLTKVTEAVERMNQKQAEAIGRFASEVRSLREVLKIKVED